MKDGAARQPRQETRRPATADREGQGTAGGNLEGVAALGPDYSVTGWSSGAERLTGWSAASAVGRPLSELFAGLDGPEIGRASRTGHSVEAELVRSQGVPRTDRIVLEISALLGPSGAPAGFAVVMRAPVARLDGLAIGRDDMPDAGKRRRDGLPPTFLIDPAVGTVVDASDSAASLLGLDRGDLAGSMLDDLLRSAGAVIVSDSEAGIMGGGELSLPDVGSGGMSRAYVCTVVPILSSGRALAMMVLHDVTRWIDLEAELSRANVELSRMARHDHLTGLFNKAMFLDTLALANSRLERTGGMLGVLYIDLDGFKPVNDRFGHDAGDRVLVEVAQRLRRAVRASDVVARLGGDEFGAILENLRMPEDALKVGRHIIEQIAQPLDVAGTPVVMSASIGAVVTDRMVPDSGALLIQADWQMYQAKSTGHGQVGLGRVHETGNGHRAAPGA